jgi:hypothetical protein
VTVGVMTMGKNGRGDGWASGSLARVMVKNTF